MFSFVSPPLMPVLRLVRGRRGHPVWDCLSHLLKLISSCHPVMFFCYVYTLDTSPPHPFPAEGGKDSSDDHTLWICAVRLMGCYRFFHRPSCPCSVWFVVYGRASHTQTHLLHTLLLPPPPAGRCACGPTFELYALARMYPREGHRFAPTLNKQSTTKVRALALLCLAPA
jgi:hypothetical protein